MANKQERTKAKTILRRLAGAARDFAGKVEGGQRYRSGYAFDAAGNPGCVFGAMISSLGFQPTHSVKGNAEALKAYLQHELQSPNGTVSSIVVDLNRLVDDIATRNDAGEWNRLPGVLKLFGERADHYEFPGEKVNLTASETDVELLQMLVGNPALNGKFSPGFLEGLKTEAA